MRLKKKKTRSGNLEQVISEARRIQESRENTYRERALKILPLVCGRCGREFSGKSMKELTVHHKDHNHDNNPSDGSNWELLCRACHDREHFQQLRDGEEVESILDSENNPNYSYKPFANLNHLIKD
ncbi:MAG: YajD family HNH nuclease [Syntrophaceae bacterium]|nr:YajD family HNH nuclease [Syntrophaceae bacterium]